MAPLPLVTPHHAGGHKAAPTERIQQQRQRLTCSDLRGAALGGTLSGVRPDPGLIQSPTWNAMTLRDNLFGRPTAGSSAADVGLLVLRVAAGLAIALLHGIGKVPPAEGFVGMVGGMGFPSPVLFAWLAGLAEFLGGLLLAVGLLTRPTALVLVIHFAVVVLVAHAGDAIGDRELPLIFWAAAFQFLLTGPGRFSLDAMIHRRR